MIETTSFKALKMEKYDLVLAIVRHLVNPIPGVIHVPALSPSEILTTAQLAMRDEGMWHESSFGEIFEPAFEAQIKQDAYAQRLLHRIIDLDKQGKRIALVCYCTDRSQCHRRLLIWMLRDMGVPLSHLIDN